MQNSKEPESDAYIRRLARKRAKGKGKVPMEESKISRGLAELDPIRVVLALPTPTEEESGWYAKDVARGGGRCHTQTKRFVGNACICCSAVCTLAKGKAAYHDLKE